MMGSIGKGSSGSVLLVEERNTGSMFAMKVIRKEYTVKKEQVKHTVQQRRIMAAVSFPFLAKLESHFQTRNSMCLSGVGSCSPTTTFSYHLCLDACGNNA